MTTHTMHAPLSHHFAQRVVTVDTSGYSELRQEGSVVWSGMERSGGFKPVATSRSEV
jgi:hypothetical protein